MLNIKASLVGFNGTAIGKRCETVEEFIDAWKMRKLSKRQYEEVEAFNRNPEIALINKLLKNRNKKKEEKIRDYLLEEFHEMASMF